ncbi:hypothetical protein Salat_1214300 [Sesamum alatum]|uniref:DUF4283 domain-containing protein n=1 Tax=Sesamum alatum TaxID=300844 RepID=A0AAE2CNY1_9LAMI|nr:hypothetical protein Salat_1214300 [Sesamum alatum]
MLSQFSLVQSPDQPSPANELLHPLSYGMTTNMQSYKEMVEERRLQENQETLQPTKAQGKEKEERVTSYPTYRSKLINSSNHVYFPTWLQNWEEQSLEINTQNPNINSDESLPELSLDTNLIKKIRQSWRKALIIQTVGLTSSNMNIGVHFQRIWKTAEPILPTDLGQGYYTINLKNEEDYHMALVGGPWFYLNHYIAV